MTQTQRPAQTLHVEHCMGTVFTIAIRDEGDWALAVAEVVDWLHQVDRLFSTYKGASEISQIRRGELEIADAHSLVQEVADLCDRFNEVSAGYFSTRLPGGFDPTGLVKGWAIEHASELLRSRGSQNHAVNGGGDMQLAGEASPGQPWRVGISDPRNPGLILATVQGRDFAVATSGVAERGEHILDPFSGVAVNELASVTVVGPSLTSVDVLATGAFAMGNKGVAWLENQPGHEAFVVRDDGSAAVTTGFPAPSVSN